MEKEKAEINTQLEEIRGTIKAYEDKVRLCVEQTAKVAAEAELEKVIELSERGIGGERKFMKNSLDEFASELLRERKCYVLGQVKKNEQDEEVVGSQEGSWWRVEAPGEEVSAASSTVSYQLLKNS